MNPLMNEFKLFNPVFPILFGMLGPPFRGLRELSLGTTTGANVSWLWVKTNGTILG